MSKLTQSAGRINTLLQRVLNAIALCLIALAVFAQCIYVFMPLEGGRAGSALASIFDTVRPAIFPGLLLAFLKFVLNAIRSFKSEQARLKALAYLLIATSPLTLGLSKEYLAKDAQIAKDRDNATESEQFLQGRDWAREKQPVSGGKCTGTSEFVRGCRFAVKERQDMQFQAGYEWARQNQPVKASACQGRPYFALGCRRYFFEHLVVPKPAGQGKYEGITTEECRAEVNANYELADQLDIETDSSPRVAISRLRRHWAPDLQDCENYDRHAKKVTTITVAPYERLTSLVEKLKAHEALTEEEQAAVDADVIEISKRNDEGYKRAYFLLHAEYAKRLQGKYKEVPAVRPQMSCEEYRGKNDEMRRLDNERVAAMRALKRDDGVITNGAMHAELNRQRLDMLWDWKRYTDGAKAAGCDIKSD